MSSVIFQPLLHDPLGWKTSKSTYTDHYKWRKYRSTSKGKKISTYGQQYQKQQPVIIQSLPTTKYDEQTIKPIVLADKNEENRGRTVTYRSASAKTPSPATPVYIVEHKPRPASANEAVLSSSSSSAPIPRIASATTEDEKVRVEKEKTPLEINNDNSRHWLTYPNPKTPQYITDIKLRLGQLKGSSTLDRPSSASSATNAATAGQSQTASEPPRTAGARPTSASSQKMSNEDQHQFLSFERRDTPDDLRAARYRVDKHRYNPSLDNYPPRPQTSPARPNESSKVNTIQPEFDEEEQQQPQSLPTITPKIDAWVAEDERSTHTFEQESLPSLVVQMVDCDGLPPEYADALETANAAQEEYQKNLKMNVEKRLDSPAYRLSVVTPDSQTDSVMAYHTQQQPMMMNNQLRQMSRRTPNHFGTWVRTATDKERASAMKILQEVLNQPVNGFDAPSKSKTVFKQAPAPPPVRASSATRKLGRTRNQHQFPCEICEKLLIKRHVWDLSGIDCPHSTIIS